MGTMTISIDDDVEQQFRELAPKNILEKDRLPWKCCDFRYEEMD